MELFVTVVYLCFLGVMIFGAFEFFRFAFNREEGDTKLDKLIDFGSGIVFVLMALGFLYFGKFNILTLWFN